MGWAKYLLLGILFFSVFYIVKADTYGGIDDCAGWCGSRNYSKAYDCFLATRNKADASLAVATCAFNNYDDTIAEDWALKSANQKLAWLMWVRKIPGVAAKIRTGGLAETYMLAYEASGETRYESTARDYLRTSGQCYDSTDVEACVDGYFMSYISQIKNRNLGAARVSAINPEKLALKGTITDIEHHPLKHVKVTFNCGGKMYTTYTDAAGQYLYKLNLSFDYCPDSRLYVKLEYYTANKTWFRVMWGANQVWAGKKLHITTQNDLTQNFELGNMTGPDYFALMRTQDVKHYGLVYHHMTEALEYYKDFLKINVDYMLPVDVKVSEPHDGTWYDPTDSTIVINARDTAMTSRNRPINREFHEFSHHAMYCLYRSWPTYTYPGGPAPKNHGGYANPSTADSYMEGWAEFMALQIAQHYNYPQPGVYPTDGSVEVNWKAYDIRGLMEEYAVDGVLWDLYDGKDDDNVQLTFQQIWDVIKNKDDNFADVMDKFVAKYPSQKAAIEEIWKQHGFFADTTPGDGVYNKTYEAYLDYNKNNRRDAAEPWVDYSTQPPWAFPYFTWQAGEKIGPAANYQRPLRKAAPYLPEFSIKVDNNVPFYTIKVAYKGHPELNYQIVSQNIDGKINAPLAPPGTEATLTITPFGVAEQALILNTKDYTRFGDYAEQGYYAEYTYPITGTIPTVEELELAPDSDSTPYYEALDVPLDPNGFKYNAPIEKDDYDTGISLSGGMSGKSSIWVWVIIIVVVVAGIGFFVVKGKKHNKHHKAEEHKEKKKINHD